MIFVIMKQIIPRNIVAYQYYYILIANFCTDISLSLVYMNIIRIFEYN